MLSIGRWRYDPKRCLSIYCKRPAESDDHLKAYTVSPELAALAMKPLTLTHQMKRKCFRRHVERHEECKCFYCVYYCFDLYISTDVCFLIINYYI